MVPIGMKKKRREMKMANITFEQCLRNAVEIEIERIVKQGVEEVSERLRRQVPDIVTKISLTIMERISIQTRDKEIIIRAVWEDGKK